MNDAQNIHDVVNLVVDPAPVEDNNIAKQMSETSNMGIFVKSGENMKVLDLKLRNKHDIRPYYLFSDLIVNKLHILFTYTGSSFQYFNSLQSKRYWPQVHLSISKPIL